MSGLAVALIGCDDGSAPQSANHTSNITLSTLPEGEQHRDKLTPAPNVVWTIAPGAGLVCKPDAGAVAVVRQAVSSMAGELARVDFAGLSLPRFVTVTQKLKLNATSWDSAEVEIDACGAEGGRVKWQIYSVRGQEIEQRPDLPLVHRWAHLYALYSVEERAVKRLLATVRGFVLE